MNIIVPSLNTTHFYMFILLCHQLYDGKVDVLARDLGIFQNTSFLNP